MVVSVTAEEKTSFVEQELRKRFRFKVFSSLLICIERISNGHREAGWYIDQTDESIKIFRLVWDMGARIKISRNFNRNASSCHFVFLFGVFRFLSSLHFVIMHFEFSAKIELQHDNEIQMIVLFSQSAFERTSYSAQQNKTYRSFTLSLEIWTPFESIPFWYFINCLT